MNTVHADLDLPATPKSPRRLSLTLGLLTGQLSVFVVMDHHVIACAHGGAAEVAESVALGHVLRIGYTSFKLLPEEVEPVRAFLAQFPSPATPSLAAVHEATAAPDLAQGGDCGAQPLSVCTDRGSLDEHAV